MGSINILKPNTIYKLSNQEIFWTGGEYLDNFLDKQFTGQYYTEEQVMGLQEISLEEAIREEFIHHNRFTRMNSSDKTDTVKIMLKEMGLFYTLCFLSNTPLQLSEEELNNLLDMK